MENSSLLKDALFLDLIALLSNGQQHGSVYWKKGSSKILSSLDPKKPLVAQFGQAFSTKESPIWMDSSTTEQCRAIEKAVGGALKLSELTGSRAYERYACIDHTDGAGMNLMDIKKRVWSKQILKIDYLQATYHQWEHIFVASGEHARLTKELLSNCESIEWQHSSSASGCCRKQQASSGCVGIHPIQTETSMKHINEEHQQKNGKKQIVEEQLQKQIDEQLQKIDEEPPLPSTMMMMILLPMMMIISLICPLPSEPPSTISLIFSVVDAAMK
ncbi:hypothetical protein L6452_17983 [Arctium lappa]|uniref:Uncharacterized protein n=1 Tax=Arctium lappa TaxID=4217 RepID=A0ACB9C570_ARCLA|nr:hypothetical protein L6452_17983 [Arctium lappa]